MACALLLPLLPHPTIATFHMVFAPHFGSLVFAVGGKEGIFPLPHIAAVLEVIGSFRRWPDSRRRDNNRAQSETFETFELFT
jgi:hypothetical protein